ncbi:MAG: nicotinamide riboside transporter PnuC [Proteobacteria bacterium]|nr:nicotinamide riboside transporter PnuC [Pseudomonadota bacterium]
MQFIRKYWDSIFFPIGLLAVFVVLRILGSESASYYELLGILFAIIGLTLIKREIAAGQLLSMVGQIFLILHFLPQKLYGQVVFCVIWGIINIVTFFVWLRPKDAPRGKELKPSYMNSAYMWLIFLGLSVLILFRLKYGLVGILDWATVYAGLVGQIALVRKKTQGWVLWILKDFMSMALFLMTGSYLLFIRTIMYAYNDSTAFLRWRKEIKIL